MDNKKPIYSKDIQKRFKIKRSFASWHIRRLENDGFIYRVKEGKYKRIFISKLGQIAIMSEVLTDDEIELISIKKKSKKMLN